MAEMSLLRRRMIEDMTIDLTLRDRRSHPRVAALALPRLQARRFVLAQAQPLGFPL
jgi:hypothetical protein